MLLFEIKVHFPELVPSTIHFKFISLYQLNLTYDKSFEELLLDKVADKFPGDLFPPCESHFNATFLLLLWISRIPDSWENRTLLFYVGPHVRFDGNKRFLWPEDQMVVSAYLKFKGIYTVKGPQCAQSILYSVKQNSSPLEFHRPLWGLGLFGGSRWVGVGSR